MKRGTRLPLLFCACFAVFLLSFFWPGPYRYERAGSSGAFLVRVNRFTASAEVFSLSHGWDLRAPGSTTNAAVLFFLVSGGAVLIFAAGYFVGRRDGAPSP